jgi:hypothetical protein
MKDPNNKQLRRNTPEKTYCSPSGVVSHLMGFQRHAVADNYNIPEL